MKQENLNNKGNAQAPYASPKVKVVAINVQGVLCQSNLQGWDRHEENW